LNGSSAKHWPVGGSIQESAGSPGLETPARRRRGLNRGTAAPLSGGIGGRTRDTWSGDACPATWHQPAVTQLPRRRKYYPRRAAAGKARVLRTVILRSDYRPRQDHGYTREVSSISFPSLSHPFATCRGVGRRDGRWAVRASLNTCPAQISTVGASRPCRGLPRRFAPCRSASCILAARRSAQRRSAPADPQRSGPAARRSACDWALVAADGASAPFACQERSARVPARALVLAER
jgi:hypothetical protein